MQVGADNQSTFVLSNNIRHVMKAQEEGDTVSCWSQRKCVLKKTRPAVRTCRRQQQNINIAVNYI